MKALRGRHSNVYSFDIFAEALDVQISFQFFKFFLQRTNHHSYVADSISCAVYGNKTVQFLLPNPIQSCPIMLIHYLLP